MIRVLIADDHAVVREGLKQIVTEHPDMAIGIADTLRERLGRAYQILDWAELNRNLFTALERASGEHHSRAGPGEDRSGEAEGREGGEGSGEGESRAREGGCRIQRGVRGRGPAGD